MAKHPTIYIGPETGARLDAVDALLRGGADPDMLRLSAELAGATYSLDLENWMKAGWQDVCVQVDELLMGDIRQAGENSWVSVTSAAKLELLRARVRQQDPLGEAIGALRQLRASDTVKAVVMLHPAPGGLWVLAISFMGTTRRLNDWLSNFRMSSEKGWHQGFLQLTEQFELREGLISFPETARALGLPRLTLRDILRECAGEESRFRIWLSGHSQGAAVMQVWAARRMAEGLNPRFLTGCGLASPTVCRAGTVADPGAYPLFHVLSSDDVVPRMGSQVHLGVCLFYRADESLRRTCYVWPRDEKAVRARLEARKIMRRMADTGRCIEVGIALLRVLRSTADPTRLGAIRLLNPDWPVLRLLNQAEEDTLRTVLNAVIRRGAAACVSITGHSPEEARMAEDEEVIRGVISRIGAETTLTALIEMALNAHSILAPEGARQGVYACITTHGTNRLLPAVWLPGDPPRLALKRGGQLSSAWARSSFTPASSKSFREKSSGYPS